MKRRCINIIGLHWGHCSTACLLQDGRIIACVSEERFQREKNYAGFPEKSLRFLMEEGSIEPGEIDLVVMGSRSPFADIDDPHSTTKYALYEWISKLLYDLPILRHIYDPIHYLVAERFFKVRWRRQQVAIISQHLGIPPDRVTATDHHTAHTWSAIYGLLDRQQLNDGEYLIFTNDGNGDACCAAVNVYKDNTFSPIGETTPNQHSLALMYLQITSFLGMKPLEHEYKVMGLAPYADTESVKRAYGVLKKLVWLNDDLSFDSCVRSQSYYYWIKRHLERHRFDGVAGAAQQLVEELLVEWIRRATNRSGIRRALFSGGIFMNVKANMTISRMQELDDIWFMPSAGDESCPIGAAYWGYRRTCNEWRLPFEPHPLADLYLGPGYSVEAIGRCVNASVGRGWKVERVDDIERRVAELLAKGEIVARFNGRMEWGARALGNRSILAHPSDPGVVRVLNEKIKGRDFWMPFAGTVLKERERDYIVNPKGIEAPYMAIAFETTELARKEMRAALHPYDFTMRPQVLREEVNPSYYRLIKEFERITGIGGILNTSFNIHGEPIVCSPEDAIKTFEKSGLDYLALGPFLLTKCG